MRWFALLTAASVVLALGLGCGGPEPASGPQTNSESEAGTDAPVRARPDAPRDAPADESLPGRLAASAAGVLVTGGSPWAAAAEHLTTDKGGAAEIAIDYPLDDSVFPPDLVPPTFLWQDETEGVDAWLVDVTFHDGTPSLRVFVPGPHPTQGPLDPRALGRTNEVYQLTPRQASARTWTPSADVWAEVTKRSVEEWATVTFRGVDLAGLETVHSRGSVRIMTSADPVGAPIFYRDVPLMPSIAEGTGVIKPIEGGFVPLIAWRLRDVSLPESKVVLTGMPSCANCHSFSLDGKTLGMDVDGPLGDKGTYAIVPLAKETIIDNERVITWNSFAGKPEGHHTIGFLSRISPDGTHALTTLNESLYVSNFTDFRFLQVFYPTRGILGWWSKETDRIEALPGADDPQYVHCGPAWTPDGSSIVFSRAEAFDPYEPGRPLAQEPNDPNEPRIRYDLYRMPFADGKGGTPVPVEGASDNGMSNTFPKVSPDGKWIVYVKCRNGQLMRPDGRLWIVPLEGGEAREMRCNTPLMNSWHSFSPNGRWMVFSSKSRTPYTQMFLTHIDENGNDTPAILIPNATAENRAVNLPEFVNIAYDALESIDVPAVNHHRYYQEGGALVEKGDFRGAIQHLEKAVRADPEFVRAHIDLAFSWASLGELGNARSHYDRVLDLDPRNPYALSGLGGISELQGEPQKAAEFYRRALEGDALFVPAIRSLGLLLLGRREFEAAVAVLENAVHSRPQLDEMRWALVQALRGGGRSADAVPHLEALVDREAEVPGRPDVLLAWILATSPDASVRDGARARALMETRIAAGEGNDPVVADTLAAAQAEAGDFAAALETTKRAEDLARQYDQGLLAKIQARARLYAEGEPFREDPSTWEAR